MQTEFLFHCTTFRIILQGFCGVIAAVFLRNCSSFINSFSSFRNIFRNRHILFRFRRSKYGFQPTANCISGFFNSLPVNRIMFPPQEFFDGFPVFPQCFIHFFHNCPSDLCLSLFFRCLRFADFFILVPDFLHHVINGGIYSIFVRFQTFFHYRYQFRHVFHNIVCRTVYNTIQRFCHICVVRNDFFFVRFQFFTNIRNPVTDVFQTGNIIFGFFRLLFRFQ